MTKESAVFAYCTSDNRIKVVNALDFKVDRTAITFKVHIGNKNYYVYYDKATQEFFECILDKETLCYIPHKPFHLKAKSVERVITERWSVK